MKQTILVKFIYTNYLKKSTLHASLFLGRVRIVVYLSTCSTYSMSQSGLGSGSSLEDDRRPKIFYGQVDSKGWVTGLRDYVNSMKDRCPAEDHPSEEWLSQGSEMISLDQRRTVANAPKQGTSSVGGQRSGGPASAASSQLSAMQRNLDVTTSGVANIELSSRLAHQSQRIKDRTF